MDDITFVRSHWWLVSEVFSVNYFCRRIASPKSLLYESGCLS